MARGRVEEELKTKENRKMVVIEASVHRRVARRAALEGKTMREWVNEALKTQLRR